MYRFTLLNVLKYFQLKLQINCSDLIHVQIPSLHTNHLQAALIQSRPRYGKNRHNNMPWKKNSREIKAGQWWLIHPPSTTWWEKTECLSPSLSVFKRQLHEVFRDVVQWWLGSAGLITESYDLRGFSQPRWFYDTQAKNLCSLALSQPWDLWIWR